jgi:hypothetical protein
MHGIWQGLDSYVVASRADLARAITALQGKLTHRFLGRHAVHPPEQVTYF